MSEEKPFKPMLAVNAVSIKYPVWASAKVDGVRVVIKDDMALSRTLKPIPNAYVQETLGKFPLNGLDGEITVGPPNAQNVMQATTSGVMSEEGHPDVTFWVFDYWTDTKTPFAQRLQIMQRCFKDIDGPMASHPRVKLLRQLLCRDAHELNAFEALMLEQGFEGVMVRDPQGKYKYGRSTAKEGWLLKVKRFVDSEAVVIGFQERMHNANEARTDALGHTVRSTDQANLVPTGTLGALLVRTPEGVEFGIGTGFDDKQRAQYWQYRLEHLGKIVTYKHFQAAGVKVAPRFPVFKAWRNSIDTGEPK